MIHHVSKRFMNLCKLIKIFVAINVLSFRGQYQIDKTWCISTIACKDSGKVENLFILSIPLKSN